VPLKSVFLVEMKLGAPFFLERKIKNEAQQAQVELWRSGSVQIAVVKLGC